MAAFFYRFFYILGKPHNSKKNEKSTKKWNPAKLRLQKNRRKNNRIIMFKLL
jgi:hypothetical protein